MTSIAIIGAGMAGLSCAAHLRTAGLVPVVFDKGRGLGGRLATRRTDWGSFDHGAQYVSPKSDEFAGVLAGLVAQGAVAEWDGRFVGVPGMSALVKPLAEGLELHRETRVSRIEIADQVALHSADGPLGRFDRVIVTVPKPQSVDLLPHFAGALEAVTMVPSYTALFGFETRLEAPDMPETAHADIGWLMRNSAKPGRKGETWVLQASREWSETHLELDRPDAAARLLDVLRAALPCAVPEPAYIAGHRWRYAFVDTALGAPYLQEGPVFLAGDWCLGRRVEHAWHSGTAAAQAVLEGL